MDYYFGVIDTFKQKENKFYNLAENWWKLLVESQSSDKFVGRDRNRCNEFSWRKFSRLILEHPVNELWKLKRRWREAIEEIIRTSWKVSVKGARYLSGWTIVRRKIWSMSKNRFRQHRSCKTIVQSEKFFSSVLRWKFFFFFTKNFLKIPLTLKRIGNNRQDRIIDKGLSRIPLCCWSELYGVLSRPWNFKIKFCHLPTAFVVSGVNFKSHLHRQLDIVHCSRTCDHAKIPFSLCISITWPAMEFFHLRFAS